MVNYLKKRMSNQIEDSDTKSTKVETVLLPRSSKNVSVLDNGFIKNEESFNSTHPASRAQIEMDSTKDKKELFDKINEYIDDENEFKFDEYNVMQVRWWEYI